MQVSDFDRIYVINLPTRTDRAREMVAQLKLLGTSWHDPKVRLFAAIRPLDRGAFPTIGARGCFLSHLAVLRDAALDGLASILVLEDDVDFTHLSQGVTVADAPADSILYVGHFLTVGTEVVGWTTISPHEPIYSAHCIAWRGSTIARCASYLEAMLKRPEGDAAGGPMHVDGAFSWFRRENSDLPTFVAHPSQAAQRPSRTDIHPLRWFDRWPVARSVAGVVRRLRRGRRQQPEA